MSKITEIIFKGANHYVTSKFGPRNTISTNTGNTSNFHKGTDYGTNNKKLPIYAIEDGTVDTVAVDTYGAKYVIIYYPRLNKLFRHWHLDSYCVKKGQAVKKYTQIGVTGKTGNATGIHLHLGIQDKTSKEFLDPEEYAKTYTEANSTSTTQKPTNFLGSKGYFQRGDTHVNIGKIASFMRKTFPAYTNEKALGNFYGPYIEASIKEFQKRTGLEADGKTGPKTLAKLKTYGFKEN